MLRLVCSLGKFGCDVFQLEPGMRFDDLDVWKRSASLSANIYRAFNESREYGFKDQITRSALSIASNIAEGYERETARDRIKFLYYAKASCGEFRSQLHIGMETGLIDSERGQAWSQESIEISRMLYGLIKYWKGNL